MRPLAHMRESRSRAGGINFVGMMKYPDFDPKYITRLTKRVNELEKRIAALENTWWRRFKRWLQEFWNEKGEEP